MRDHLARGRPGRSAARTGKHDPADPDTIKFADKAIELLKKLQNKTHLVENFIALNGIATLNVGTKFVTIVPEASAIQQGKAFTSQGKDELPELGQYTTHVVQLKYAQVQEVQQAITPLAGFQAVRSIA